ncbi:MAG: YihY/virulence factor BrkB family protein [Gammaproteobacteria bacterium]|nr:YihY/virulence factor BrkB family protein [Gammaproteobacteria bacterium]MBV9621735.1 YihY/virulence factor BrkB family protein [Gammaproteobacteria bacterium]
MDGESGLARAWRLLHCTVNYWVADRASTLGAALAFYCAFSLAPLLIILLMIAGEIIGSKAAYQQVGLQLSALFGPATARVLLNAAASAKYGHGLLSTLISAGTLLVGATTVWAALEDALETIWNTRCPHRTGVRGWIRTRLLSLGVIVALGFLLLVSLTLSTVLSSASDALALRYPGVVALLSGLGYLTSLVLVSGFFALVFRFLPARRLDWPVVIAGGVLTATLFDIGRRAIGLYLAHSSEPSAFGAAASFAALLLWLYYTAQIFLFGAEFTACFGGLRLREREREAEVARAAQRS